MTTSEGWICPSCGGSIDDGDEGVVMAEEGELLPGSSGTPALLDADDYAWRPVRFHVEHFRGQLGGKLYRVTSPPTPASETARAASARGSTGPPRVARRR
jgi:hypothetical protein